MSPLKRGVLIVFEGCDKAGKSTQCKKLVDALNAENKKTELMRFPERSTAVGRLIHQYLTNNTNMDDHAIHLLFSANRWELLPKMKSLLEQGINIVIDRYAFSGTAFSSAKKGMSLEWCRSSDAGLPRPDVVFFLDLSPEAAAERGDFGTERYEDPAFQKRVYNNYKILQDDSWKIITADNSVEAVHAQLMAIAHETITTESSTPLRALWAKEAEPY